MNTFSLILQPLAAAFTGWLTIKAMLYFLFRPVRPRRIFGRTVQGILPRRQQELAGRTGAAAAALMPVDALLDRLKDPAQLSLLMPSIERHIDAYLRTRLMEKIPVLATFMGESTLQKIRASLIEEIELLLPSVIAEHADTLAATLQVERLVAARISGFPPEQLERHIRSALASELRRAGWAGAGLGFAIGLIQLGISLL